MIVLGWIVWSACAIFTALVAIMRHVKEKEYKTGQWYDSHIVVGFTALPHIVFWETVILVLFLFVGVSKLNLLWIYPLVWFGIGLAWTVRLRREGKKGPEGPNRPR